MSDVPTGWCLSFAKGGARGVTGTNNLSVGLSNLYNTFCKLAYYWMHKTKVRNRMTLVQALSLASLLIEWEIESPAVQPLPEAWAEELRAARQVITQAINRPDPGRYFFSAKRGGRGRQPRQNLVIEME